MSRLLRALLLGLALVQPLYSSAAEPPAILLAQTYHGQVDVSRYLISEKLDGVRALWNGKTLSFRSGKEIQAPRWFLDALPRQPLDGELWMGRGSFERLSGAVRRDSPDDAEWRHVRYMIFELPGAAGSFRERAEVIRQIVRPARVPWLREIEQFSVVDRSALQTHFSKVVKAGGEGLMLHHADAEYQTGRSDVLLKMKPWDDAEAEVVGYKPGKGKYVGALGALLVRMPDGKEFYLGSGFADQQRRNPPEIGTVVTYRYREFTANGLPRFATFLRVRGD